MRVRLPHEILVRPYTAVSGAWGEASYGPAERRAARVKWEDEVQQGSDGERVVVTATVLTSEPLKPKDRVWLPSLALEPPADADASDSTKARTVDSCTAAARVSGSVAFYVTRL